MLLCKYTGAVRFSAISFPTCFAGYHEYDATQKGSFSCTQWLTKEYGVATIPISVFYSNKQDDKIIRFCFAKKEETIQAAIEKLARLKVPA
jgi:aspartate/methionine/tyrosine aminotransferase